MTVLRLMLSALVLGGLLTELAEAQTPKLITNKSVYLVSSDAGKFGGCKIKISYPFSDDTDLAPYCGSNELSLGCDGLRGHTKSEGVAMYANAQLAMVSGKTVNVRVDPNKVVDTICVATRVDVNN